MLRSEFSRLIEFCCHQKNAFNLQDWIDLCGRDEPDNPGRKTMGAVVKLLAGASWYGHQEELAVLAERLCPGVALSELVQSSQLDISKFSNHLKEAIRHAQ